MEAVRHGRRPPGTGAGGGGQTGSGFQTGRACSWLQRLRAAIKPSLPLSLAARCSTPVKRWPPGEGGTQGEGGGVGGVLLHSCPCMSCPLPQVGQCTELNPFHCR
mmetsp:Transcript_21374/g.64086  ORF Transcript_21374/g.64086 Transcript_21374/m.64086 type:complete len:105 (-) Transcript_21374:536-850(-)